MGISGGSLFPERVWGRVFKESRETFNGDIQALQHDPSKLTVDLLESIGKHLQELYKLLGESERLVLIDFSIRYPLVLETEEAYKLLEALIEFIEESGGVSQLELDPASSKRVYEDSLLLTKRLQAIEQYLYKVPQLL
jgi:hypothetical protein